MYYFAPEKLPVLTTLAREFAVFNRWFASIPGRHSAIGRSRTTGRRSATSAWSSSTPTTKFKSIYDRVVDKREDCAKLYYFDQVSSTLEVVNLLQNQPQLFATIPSFSTIAKQVTLPDYSLRRAELQRPRRPRRQRLIASDQHPDHHVAEGERFIASVYQAIRKNPALWASTALLITYDEHGGIYDHVPPPGVHAGRIRGAARRDENRRAVSFRSPGRARPGHSGLAVGAEGHHRALKRADGTERIFEHASIPNTVSKWLLPGFNDNDRSPREAACRNVPRPPVAARSCGRTVRNSPSDFHQRTKATTMAVTKISVPKTPKSAFNKNRPASGLLLAQLEHLEIGLRLASIRRRKRRKQTADRRPGRRAHPRADQDACTRTPHSVQLPTARMISHAEEPGAAGGGATPAGRKAPKKAAAPKRGRRARKRG